MKIVGLTGGIGSGKSTVGRMFIELGVPVYDSDKEAKQLMVSSDKIKKAIVKLLGRKAYTDEGLDKGFIAKKVFNDPELLQKLNAIVHPEVKDHFFDWVKNQKSNYVIQETALIFENGSQNQYDYIILVTAPLELRLKRVAERDGVDEQQILDRVKNQMDDDLKMELADFCIENIDLKTTRTAVTKLHRKLAKGH